MIMLLLLGALSRLSGVSPSFLLFAQEPGKVEVVIRNFKYEVQAGVIPPDMPATITVRNLDKVRHGFTSKIFEEMDVEVESAAGAAFGRGIKGVHIQPGGEFNIRFMPTRAGKFSFQCDFHPSMRGELMMLSVGVA